MSEPIYPVLLCGGAGTRLWPLSRKSYPKQFARVVGTNSLFQQSAERLSGPRFAAPTIVTNNEFRFVVVEQLAACQISPHSMLIEPESPSSKVVGRYQPVALDALLHR